MTHELKTWPEYFSAIYSGDKKFEVRKMDRDFKVGDILFLREWDNKSLKYTGRNITRVVTYILKFANQFGIEDGFCVMSIERVEKY